MLWKRWVRIQYLGRLQLLEGNHLEGIFILQRHACLCRFHRFGVLGRLAVTMGTWGHVQRTCSSAGAVCVSLTARRPPNRTITM